MTKTKTPPQGGEEAARPLTGNEAIARGAWEAGLRVAAAYPGTPSTEILESLARYPTDDLVAQWSTNEKVALDVAAGACFAGVRALAAMKHVGLNVAADALMSQTYIGVNGGLVLVVCDDPGIHSSQNEQDTRLFCRLAMVPCLEPADAQEALDFTRAAFELSERYDTPVLIRSTTRLSHTRSVVRLGTREVPPARTFRDDPRKNVMIPAHARGRHPKLIEREQAVAAFFATSKLNRWEKGDRSLGIVTAGMPYAYIKEVLPGASVLKLAVSYPLPLELIRDFAASVDRLLVVEELEPVIETELRAAGLAAEGKAFFPRTGELSPEAVREGLEMAGVLPARPKVNPWPVQPVARPPVLCPGCPHTMSYMAIRALEARVAGDIGCYTLAALEPLRSIDTCVAMGSSIANAVGMARAGTETRPIIATIGDSTFLHAGIPPLIDAVYNDANITVIILDNHITAMTGGQDHAGTGRTLRGEGAGRIDFEQMVRACGVKWIRRVDSYDVATMYQTFREAAAYKGVSVVISDRPCVLDPVRIKGPSLAVNLTNCTACQSCMNLGCPAIGWDEATLDGRHKVKINPELCIGCTLCAQICPADGIHAALTVGGAE
ncbi:Indolepyruvate oxidoreductase subunit IorA [Rhodovastum atsumiense]|uniref:Indolepyruvate oxidoreductase subunit IorA n=1 Tax=Rhodovastum atsumiense TaxID=504468 RepID=A0A5M6ILN8_9PROT|nr:indolepyruvate ferredoxin oxidoreductase subunit alpha [Rhodovastum atsumiense]KAA5609190.1 indolepyruvate ferredoxin oxidoreductase subunit alpha [Rhodovastum atsumiense]CAH2602806.1 Indolepyruvate oxidoreductase subunit IorA [Rhodovastum atsumiense]